MNVPFQFRQDAASDEVPEPADGALWRAFNEGWAAEDYVLDRPSLDTEPSEPDLAEPEVPARRRGGTIAAGLLGLLAAAAGGALFVKTQVDPARDEVAAAPRSQEESYDAALPAGRVVQEPLLSPDVPGDESSAPISSAATSTALSAEAAPDAEPGASQALAPSPALAPAPSIAAPAAEQLNPSAGRNVTAPAKPVPAPAPAVPAAPAAPVIADRENEAEAEPVAANGRQISPAVRPAQQISGGIMNSDYPKAALKARAGGSVFVQFTVAADGQPTGCTVTRSSGNDHLDAATCRAIERRFRYKPATDPDGRPVEEVVKKRYDWSVTSRR